MNVLLVEDNVGDARLMQEAFRGLGPSVKLHVVTDGLEAMEFLERRGGQTDAPRPDLILLDLNLPKMDGREVLARIKGDRALRIIPTIILTTSDAECDITTSYQLQANCYLKKPLILDEFEGLVDSVNEFWLTRAQLPSLTNKPIHVDRDPPLPATETSVHVLLVEDSPGDVRLMQEAFRALDTSIKLHIAADGLEAMAFLNHEGEHIAAPRPDLVLLDLNLPKMDGREVLARIKGDSNLKKIPTVILTTSGSEGDIVVCYELQANCYLRKPAQLERFDAIVRTIDTLWLTKSRLPQNVAA